MDGGLFLCCGQLVGRKGGPRHINCSGSSSGYKVGGLFLEMEYCPFFRWSKTFMDQESNISYQEEEHWSVKTWMCSICEINFVSEGCSTRHILSFHRGRWATLRTFAKFMRTQDLFLSLHKGSTMFLNTLLLGWLCK